MSLGVLLYRVALSNALTIFYSCVTVFLFGVQFVRNLFRNPWTQKLRLIPPAPLNDPRYGTHKYIKVNDGTKLHYVESGDPTKPMMIFIHGFPEFWYSWRHQIVDFQKDYWCIAVDQRGYGDSEKPEGVSSYKLDLLVEDIRDLIRQLGAKKCIMVAHDWGGVVACAFRDAHPDVLSACIMLGSASRESWFRTVWGDWNQMLKSWYIFMFRMPCIGELMLLMNDMKMYEQVMLIPGNEHTTQEDIECYKYSFGKPCALTPPINFYRANFCYSLPDTLHKENVPMLVALGEKDIYLSTSLLENMEQHYTTIETKIMEKVGHFMLQQEPEKVTMLIKSFLTKHSL